MFKIFFKAAFFLAGVLSFVSQAQAAVDGQKVSIKTEESGIYVTDFAGSLSAVLNEAILEQIAKECSPLNSARSLDIHVKLDRWVRGADTQSLTISGTAVCSQN